MKKFDEKNYNDEFDFEGREGLSFTEISKAYNEARGLFSGHQVENTESVHRTAMIAEWHVYQESIEKGAKYSAARGIRERIGVWCGDGGGVPYMKTSMELKKAVELGFSIPKEKLEVLDVNGKCKVDSEGKKIKRKNKDFKREDSGRIMVSVSIDWPDLTFVNDGIFYWIEVKSGKKGGETTALRQVAVKSLKKYQKCVDTARAKLLYDTEEIGIKAISGQLAWVDVDGMNLNEKYQTFQYIPFKHIPRFDIKENFARKAVDCYTITYKGVTQDIYTESS
jgi:hypothetical protein